MLMGLVWVTAVGHGEEYTLLFRSILSVMFHMHFYTSIVYLLS